MPPSLWMIRSKKVWLTFSFFFSPKKKQTLLLPPAYVFLLQLNIPLCVNAFSFISTGACSNLGFSSYSLLPCGGEHGVFRRRGAALPTHRSPLLWPQRRLGRAAALGAEFLQPDRSFHRRSPPACPHTRKTTNMHTHTHTPRSVTHCTCQ